MDDPQFQLIAEQLGRMKDNIESRFQQIESTAAHEKELTADRFQAVRTDAEIRAKAVDDHECRLRTISDSVTSLKSSHTIGQTAQAVLSLILAAIAAWLGSRR